MKTKRIVSAVLVFAWTLFLGFPQVWAGGQQKDKTPELVWAFATWGTMPPETGKVETAINAYLAGRNMGFKVKLMPMGIADMTQKLNLMLASPSEPLDVFFCRSFLSNIDKGQLVPLDEYLSDKGQGMVKTVGEVYLQAGRVNGVQYGIPSIRDMASGLGFLITKEYVDKYKLDISSIKKLEDIPPILATIKKNEPDFYPLSMNAGFQLLRSINFDPLGDNFGVIMPGNSTRVVNLFETSEYRQRVEFFHSWYRAGYISPDDAASNETAVSVMKAGKACAQFTANKPGIVTENELSTGRKLEFADLGNAIVTTGGIQGIIWAVAHNTKYPDKAVELLNLFFTDPTLINLINYGIEGEHYVKKTDGTITFPSGVTTMNSGYNLAGMDWQLGNSYLAYPWEGKPADLAAQMKAFNDRGIVSSAYGFVFDNSKVLTQISALTAVADQYRQPLEYGAADPSLLNEFNAKLKAAGLDVVIAEKQRQYDAWRASKK
ncbi:ABC transporter substrate-binding protein [Spirochaetia bacterium]|nr:ABC transporter substrate-binding protein [Spirochaetia bacterium]